MYIYTFNLFGKDMKFEGFNLANACEKLLNQVLGVESGFIIEKRGTQYLQKTPFNERTHIVRFGNTICIVKQTKI